MHGSQLPWKRNPLPVMRIINRLWKSYLAFRNRQKKCLFELRWRRNFGGIDDSGNVKGLTDAKQACLGTLRHGNTLWDIRTLGVTLKLLKRQKYIN